MGSQNRPSNSTITLSLKLIVAVLASAFMALYISVFMTDCYGLTEGLSNIGLRALPLFILLLASFWLFMEHAKRFKDTLFKYRHLVALLAFVFMVAFQLNGSSIGEWAKVLPGAVDYDLLWGVSQSIRSDEWAINIPSMLAQEQIGYSEVNDLLRGVDTNVALMPSLPSFSLITIFKPYYWGYLLLGASYGVSWFWAFKNVVLFIVAFDFFYLLLKNRGLSFAAACIITFSPYAQWWNSQDVMIFGQLLVILLHWMLFSEKRVVRIVCAIAIPWACGCYLFIAYPAWQVPCFYIFAILGIFEIVRFVKLKKQEAIRIKRYPEMITLIVFLILAIISTVLIFMGATQAIEGMSNTLYPGTRLYTGGDGWNVAFDWIPSIFYAIAPADLPDFNPCARSAYFSLFPISILLAIYVIIKRKNRLLMALLILDLVFLWLMFFGMPEIIVKITLLSNVGSANRLLIATGFIDVILLMVSIIELINMRKNGIRIGLSEQFGNSWKSVIAIVGLSIVAALVLCVACWSQDPVFWTKINCILLGIATFMIVLTLLLLFTSYCHIVPMLFGVAVFAIVFTSGICVNPVQRGISVLTDYPVYEEIEQIADEDPDALWISEGSWIFGNLVASAGAPSLTSTNTYPNLDAWNTMDPDGDFEEVYMRYTNIETVVENELSGEEFELLGSDYMKVRFTPESLEDLGVKYLFAVQEHEDNDEITYNKLYQYEHIILYELEYI